MTGQNADYDAAQALLDLQGTVKQETPGGYKSMCCGSNSREDMEKTAKLFWNCFISSEIPVVSGSTPNRHESVTISQETLSSDYPKALKQFDNYSTNKLKSRFVSNMNVSKNYRNLDKKKSKTKDFLSITNTSQTLQLLDTIDKRNGKNITKTREMETQTEESYFNPNIEYMENTIKNLCERIQSLEAQLKQSNLSNQICVLESSEHEDNQSYGSQQDTTKDKNSISISKTVKYSKRIQFDDTKDLIQDKNNEFNKVKTNHNFYSKTSDLIPIGDGHVAVPARLLKHINWSSYTSATRKLLTAVFSRRILATHSLTGKPSPAFPNKPAKKRLDPALVNDIVQTVVERCSVPENVVRTSITTKCADESKMFKTRQSNKKRRTIKKNCENVSPTTSESESGDSLAHQLIGQKSSTGGRRPPTPS